MFELEINHNNFDTFQKKQKFVINLVKNGLSNNFSYTPYSDYETNSDDLVGMRWTLDDGNNIWLQFLDNKDGKITKLIIKVRYESLNDVKNKLGEIATEMCNDEFRIIARNDDFNTINYYGLTFILDPWYKWIATDSNGHVYAYHYKPYLNDSFFSTGDIHDEGRRIAIVDFKGEWKKSLMEIVKK